jgi:hypothetical protein
MPEHAGLNDEQAARLLDALCLQNAALGLCRTGARTAAFDTGKGPIEFAVERADVDGAFFRQSDFALRIVKNDPGDSAATIAHIARGVPALSALIFGGDISLDDAADPARLLHAAVAARRVNVEHRSAAEVRGLPPCLDIKMRPDEPHAPLDQAFLPPAPCDDCSHAMWCAANATAPRGSRDGLRPLRHRDPVTAVMAAIRALSLAWNVPENEGVASWIRQLVAMRRGSLSVPAPPFELSLKREYNRLAPVVRVVDIHPQALQPSPSHEASCIRRREGIRDSAISLNEGLVARTVDDFLQFAQTHQSSALRLSYGIETPIQGGALRTQLYVHVQADNDDTGPVLVRAALAWAGAKKADIDRFAAFSDNRPIALLAHAPTPEDPRRIKIYIPAPLDTRHPDSGLEPLDAPAYAPSRGLAVLRCGAGRIDWEKWDFPCAAHFQRSEPVFEDFMAGMDPEDLQRVRRIIDGREFVAWPTWLSVRRNARTIYFNPR